MMPKSDSSGPLVAILVRGGRNAGLLAVEIPAASDPALREKVLRFKRKLAAPSRGKDRRPRAEVNKVSGTHE